MPATTHAARDTEPRRDESPARRERHRPPLAVVAAEVTRRPCPPALAQLLAAIDAR